MLCVLYCKLYLLKHLAVFYMVFLFISFSELEITENKGL